ncbi:peptidylprolyl isomerase, partial [Escherichia coli]|uniref:peptidylprolyl isomerase n=1 Tax=Escherichia coli TaxID=562 RepID=UPI001EDD3852
STDIISRRTGGELGWLEPETTADELKQANLTEKGQLSGVVKSSVGFLIVRITIGQQDDLAQARPVQRSMSLGWCYLALNLRHGVLSEAQGQKLLMLIQQSGLLSRLPIPNSVITPS